MLFSILVFVTFHQKFMFTNIVEKELYFCIYEQVVL